MSRRKVGITVDFLDDVMLNVFTRDKIGWLLEMSARHGRFELKPEFAEPFQRFVERNNGECRV